MGIGTSIGNFGSLTMTDSEGVFSDVGALWRNTGSLSRDTGALGGNANGLIGNPDTLSCDPDALSSNPEALSFGPDALSRDPDGLSFDPDGLSFEPETLSFDPDGLSFGVFHQRRDSNGLVFSHLRNICKNHQRIGRTALLRGLGRPAGRPYHGTVSSKPSKIAFPEHSTFNIQH